jgi:two-component system, NarL family, invasion response regulator UvrY
MQQTLRLTKGNDVARNEQDHAVEKTFVLLVDDHAVVREGYRRLIERSTDLHVAAEASTAADAVRIFAEVMPNVTVMDVSLPDKSGIEALRQIVAHFPVARVLMFSIHDEPMFAERALEAGASGYLTKGSAPDLLIEAIRAVARGEVFVSPDLSATSDKRSGRRIDFAISTLSTRELEIARLLAQGLSVREIAERLCLTYKTAANCQTAIRRKLDASTPARLNEIAMRCNWLLPR